MAEILQFPSKDVKLNKIIQDAINESVGDNPELAKCFEMVVNEIRQTIKDIDSNPPTFQFTSIGNSLQDNVELIKTAVSNMRDEYSKIICHLLTLLLKEKLAACKTLHK